jgi:hypothetical protein
MAGFFIISFMEVPGANQSIPAILDDSNDVSNAMGSSPKLDNLSERMERSFSFDMNGIPKAPAEVFEWEFPIDTSDEEFATFPIFQPNAPIRRRPKNERMIVLTPFESCISVELAVKTLRKFYSDKE